MKVEWRRRIVVEEKGDRRRIKIMCRQSVGEEGRGVEMKEKKGGRGGLKVEWRRIVAEEKGDRGRIKSTCRQSDGGER